MQGFGVRAAWNFKPCSLSVSPHCADTFMKSNVQPEKHNICPFVINLKDFGSFSKDPVIGRLDMMF